MDALMEPVYRYAVTRFKVDKSNLNLLRNYFETIEKISLFNDQYAITKIRLIQSILLLLVLRLSVFAWRTLSPAQQILWYDLFRLLGFKPAYNLIMILQIGMMIIFYQLLYFRNYRSATTLIKMILFENYVQLFPKIFYRNRLISLVVRDAAVYFIKVMKLFIYIACKL